MSLELERKDEASVDPGKIMILNAEIQEFMQNIKSSLDTIDDLVDGSVTYYSSSTYSDFVSKKANLKLSKENIITNVNSYIDDYNYIVSLFRLNDTSITAQNVENNDFKEE